MDQNTLYKSPAAQREMMEIYEAVLAEWPAPCETMTVPTRFGETFVVAGGDEVNPALVLLHGAGSNSATWAGEAARYQLRYKLYAVDLIGEPGKSAPSRPSWDGPAYSDWLEQVLDGLKVEKAILLGLSQGGWTALKFATQHPERIEALVLLTPGGVVPDRLSFFLRALPLSLLGSWGVARLQSIVLGEVKLTEAAERFARLSMVYFKARYGKLPIFSDEQLRRLSMPVLLLGGKRDSIRDVDKIATRMQYLLPDLTTHIFPEAGHALIETANWIIPFLQKSAEAGAFLGK
jgi:pimeloyl-ACP methyl ester carboxylesterase